LSQSVTTLKVALLLIGNVNLTLTFLSFVVILRT